MASTHLMPRPRAACKLPITPLAELDRARQAHLRALQSVLQAGAGELVVDDMRAFESAAWQLVQLARGAA